VEGRYAELSDFHHTRFFFMIGYAMGRDKLYRRLLR
jgi:hypothetical protein